MAERGEEVTKVYSLNEEDYFEDFEDMLTGDEEVGGEYWEADKKTYKASDFFDMLGMLERMVDNACEEAGEHAEDFGRFKTLADQDACEAEIRAVLDKYLACNFWVAKRPIKCEFTKDDLTTICPACNGSGEGMYEGTRCSTCGGKGEVT